jgi:hypothetical protein
MLTEDCDIQQHEKYQNDDNSSEVVFSLLETDTEHIKQLVEVNNRQISPKEERGNTNQKLL